jgi:hypothetical protein
VRLLAPLSGALFIQLPRHPVLLHLRTTSARKPAWAVCEFRCARRGCTLEHRLQVKKHAMQKAGIPDRDGCPRCSTRSSSSKGRGVTTPHLAEHVLHRECRVRGRQRARRDAERLPVAEHAAAKHRVPAVTIRSACAGEPGRESYGRTLASTTSGSGKCAAARWSCSCVAPAPARRTAAGTQRPTQLPSCCDAQPSALSSPAYEDPMRAAGGAHPA